MSDKTKQLTQLEIDNIIDKSINLSIISYLLKINLINAKQYFVIKEKNKKFLLIATDLPKIMYNIVIENVKL